MVLNLVLLMFVTVIPFPTGLLADHLQTASDQHVAAAVYAGTLLAMWIAFFSTYLWAAHRRLFAGWIARRSTSATCCGATSRGCSSTSPRSASRSPTPTSASALCGLVALYYLHPGRPLRADARPFDTSRQRVKPRPAPPCRIESPASDEPDDPRASAPRCRPTSSPTPTSSRGSTRATSGSCGAPASASGASSASGETLAALAAAACARGARRRRRDGRRRRPRDRRDVHARPR